MTPTVRIPAGPITPHGAYHILHDRIPQFGYLSYDGSVVIHMMGGLSIADKFASPERVEVVGLKGLIAPWRIIDQKGATQDGVSFVDALYDPCEPILDVRVKGRNPAMCRRTARYLTDSLDPKQEGELFWFTHELGRWWAPIRWFKPADDPVTNINTKTQELSLRLRADNAFWQSYPCVDEFVFSYAAAADNFEVDDPNDLGTGWTVALSGSGTGTMMVNDGEATSNLANDKYAVARKNSYTTTSNNQVIDIQLGTFGQWFYPTNAYVEAWGRMNNTGTPGTSGIRLRLFRHKLRLSYFVAGVETVLRERILIVPPLPRERWRVIPGGEGNERTYTVMRGGATLFSTKETGTASLLGAANRSVGIGMYAGGNDRPPSIRDFTTGDNTTVSQSKFLERINAGDQDFYDNFTCHGPGLFKIWNGPGAGAEEYVEFGPLLPGQVMQIRSDPRKRGVVDMTSTPPSPQQLSAFQKALRDFLNFATGNNATPLATEIQSWFGIMPPQGNPFSLMHGRFSRPIPAKSPGKPAETYHVKVAIDDGNADSKIVASGTPLRRNPY